MKTKTILTLAFICLFARAYCYVRVDSIHVVNATSCKTCNGTATAYVTSGFPPYTYNWSNGETSSKDSALCPGSYYVEIRDSHGDTTFSVCTVGPAVIAAMSANNTSCSLNNGSATVSASGGTSPYTYLWSTGATGTSITGLSAGTYSVSVTDKNGCGTVDSVTIYNSTLAFDTTEYITPATCSNNNGSAMVMAYGGAMPYTYSWTPSGGTSNNATGLSAGTYTVTLTDANGCTITTSVVIPSSGPIPTLSVTNISCYGGNNGAASVSSINGGVSPYTYLWSPGGSTSSSITGLTAGSYSVTITDKNGCNSTNVITVGQPAPLSFVADTVADTGSCSGSANIIVSGGTGPYSFTWSTTVHATDSMNMQSVDSLCAGAYLLCVTDANGCSTCDSVHIRHAPHKVTGIQELSSASSAILIYPDPNKGQFKISLSGLPENTDAVIDITNVLGEVIYKTSVMAPYGTFIKDISMDKVPDGLYFVRITTSNNIFTSKIVIGR